MGLGRDRGRVWQWGRQESDNMQAYVYFYAPSYACVLCILYRCGCTGGRTGVGVSMVQVLTRDRNALVPVVVTFKLVFCGSGIDDTWLSSVLKLFLVCGESHWVLGSGADPGYILRLVGSYLLIEMGRLVR